MKKYESADRFGIITALAMTFVAHTAMAQGTDDTEFDTRPYDPLFMVQNCEGTCTIAVPDAPDSSVPIQEGRAYPYGSRVTTGEASSLLALLSSENTCKIQPLTTTTIRSTGKSSRVIDLHKGKAVTSVGADFSKFKTLDVVSDIGIKASLIAGGFEVASETTPATEIFTVNTTEPNTEQMVEGPNFRINRVGNDERLRVETNLDKLFVRVSNVKGRLAVDLVNHEGVHQTVELKTGHSVKIWRLPIEGGGVAVQALVLDAEDNMVTVEDEDGKVDDSKTKISFVDRR